MGKAMGETYTNAGILKKAGAGLVLDIAGKEFFLVSEDLRSLMSDQTAEVVNHLGEAEGIAWLSPIVANKKLDMTSLIARRIYSVPYRGFGRVINGDQKQTIIKEYHPAGPGA